MKAILHRTGAFERWDTLAWKYYGDPLAYDRIVEANPALDIGAVLPSGVIVLIPVLPLAEVNQALTAKDLPPWKR
ncbi:MAG: tail protein X [Candidatus Accumulibacter sp.]|jgi:phage tail protein X|nr:tail protein X [Accumulibacter sp.]